jgi:8-oxo-dGTP diphosphatase
MMNIPHRHVAVGLLKQKQCVLMAKRSSDKPLAGYWEFPGGKLESGEIPYDALVRELQEELGVVDIDATAWLVLTHSYEHIKVTLHFFLVHAWRNEPTGLEGQELQWLNVIEPKPDNSGNDIEHLPANKSLIKWLSLPDECTVTPMSVVDWNTWQSYLERWHGRTHSTIKRLLHYRMIGEGLIENATWFEKTQVMVSSRHPESWWQLVSGVHLTAEDLKHRGVRPKDYAWCSASCHNKEDMLLAKQQGIDYVLLGHVKATNSHPNSEALGWQQWQTLASMAGCPTFAIGGLTSSDRGRALSHGGHGVALLGAAW